MAFFKSQKSLFNSLLVAAGGATALAYFYPSVREVVLTNMQIDEADALTVKKIEEAYQKLQKAKECNSLLKKYLTKDVLEELKYRKTKLGASLYDIIRSGVFNLDSNIGVYAADAESYRVFAPLFDPIINEYHNFSKTAKQPETDLNEGKTSEFPPLDPEGKFIISTRIRCGRTLVGYPFNPLLTEDDYLIMQEKVSGALRAIKDDELRGTYYKLEEMDENVRKDLINEHFLFKEGDRFLQHAKSYKYWPKGRGIYFNSNKTFLVWVNEEDHLRIISMEEGSNVGRVFGRLIRGLKAIEEKVSFSRDDRLGWLTFCPTNLGSTIRASVHIYLPKLSARSDFKDICESLKLQVRGIHGEHSGGKGGIYDISNKTRLGISEYEAIKQMYDGVKELIRLEKEMK